MNRTSKSAMAFIVIVAALLASLPAERRSKEALPPPKEAAAQSRPSQHTDAAPGNTAQAETYGRAPITHTQLTVTLNGVPIQLTINALKTSGGMQLLDSYSNGAVIHPWPGHETKAIAEIGDNLYTIDLMTKRVERLLEDASGAYRLQETENGMLGAASPVWGENATVSPDGRTLIFFSNRNAALDSDYNGFMWRKNLDTGEEQSLSPGGYSVLGWGLNHELFIRRSDRIIEVDTASGTETEAAPFSLIAAVSYPYLINQDDYGKLNVTYLLTGETASYSYPDLNAVRQIFPSPYDPWAVLINQVHADAATETIDLINLCTGEFRHIYDNAGPLQYVRWISPDSLIVYSEPNLGTDDTGHLVHLQSLLDKPVLNG